MPYGRSHRCILYLAIFTRRTGPCPSSNLTNAYLRSRGGLSRRCIAKRIVGIGPHAGPLSLAYDLDCDQARLQGSRALPRRVAWRVAATNKKRTEPQQSERSQHREIHRQGLGSRALRFETKRYDSHDVDGVLELFFLEDAG